MSRQEPPPLVAVVNTVRFFAQLNSGGSKVRFVPRATVCAVARERIWQCIGACTALVTGFTWLMGTVTTVAGERNTLSQQPPPRLLIQYFSAG